MEFGSAGFFSQLKDVWWFHTTTWHNDDASVGFFNQFFQQWDTCRSSSFLSGSEDAVTSQFDDVFQCFHRVAAHVECTVESYAHVAHGIHQLLHGRHVYVAFGCQATEYHAIGSQLAGYLDVVKHDFLFKLCVKEVPSTRANDNVQLGLLQ